MYTDKTANISVFNLNFVMSITVNSMESSSEDTTSDNPVSTRTASISGI